MQADIAALLDQALFDLYKQQCINYADALHHSDSANDLRLMIKLQNNERKGLQQMRQRGAITKAYQQAGLIPDLTQYQALQPAK